MGGSVDNANHDSLRRRRIDSEPKRKETRGLTTHEPLGLSPHLGRGLTLGIHERLESVGRSFFGVGVDSRRIMSTEHSHGTGNTASIGADASDALACLGGFDLDARLSATLALNRAFRPFRLCAPACA